jgi:L-fuconolactonase
MVPDFGVVDTHLHVWDPGRLRYAWLDGIPKLNRPHLLADYDAACGPVRVEKMVFVQCECEFSQYKDEADWVAGLAAEDRRIAGIVPWAPLEKGEAVRDELAALAANPLVKGVRRIIQFEPDPEFCLRPGFVRGVQLLADFGLHFEICIAHHHMANAIRLVRQCPDVRFILDHIGKPDIKNRVREPWATQLAELAAMSNVWCKVSGLVSEADHDRWTRDDLKPYVDRVVECFGADRVMYGGDWPVATLATDYPRWVETLRWAVAGCSPTELNKLFRDNAVAFYRLIV